MATGLRQAKVQLRPSEIDQLSTPLPLVGVTEAPAGTSTEDTSLLDQVTLADLLHLDNFLSSALLTLLADYLETIGQPGVESFDEFLQDRGITGVGIAAFEALVRGPASPQ
ncbi:MAG: hypothetical protein HY000_13060 [Planctomycetes bacterium]|nr:hypothetical protein [Planctomycetota bacterium]